MMSRTGSTANCWRGWLLLVAGLPVMAVAAEPEVIAVPGLSRPVQIRVDRWGVPHIEAETEADLFFAQGYYAAGDRLFQFEMWRRQATGTVSEILGKRELKRDIGTRLLKFRGNLTTEFNHYHPRGSQIITSYVRGVNARIAEVNRDPTRLPIEFQLLGIQPQPWTPDVVISRHQGLVHNATQELALGRSVALVGADKVQELIDFHPGTPDVALDPAIDGTLLFGDILELYRLARSPLKFLPEDVAPAARRETSQHIPLLPIESRDAQRFNLRDVGSNNWVVSGSRSKSGRPLMANDPHRVLHIPSLRYFAHLKAPGWNVIGGGEPVLPGLSIGHNEHGAWGLTIYRIDAEDLYVYETHPDDPQLYRYQDGWERMTTLRETIVVKGGSPVTVELHYTRHGPVLSQNAEHNRAFALRAGWLEVGAAPYLASLRMDGARNWDEFREACSYSHLPGLNMVWAGKDGQIGWQVVGYAPVRPNWNGLVPVPGDGRYEWDGRLPIKQLPNVHNPEHGFWNTSNEAIIPEGYPHRNMVGWNWADPYRGDRVREVLTASEAHTAAGMAELQLDELSIPARKLLGLLRPLIADRPKYRTAQTLFADWDYQLRAESSAAGLYVMWERRLEETMRDRLVPANVKAYLPELSMRDIIQWLSAPDERLGSDPVASRNEILLSSLDAATAELMRKFGDDPAQWNYGQPDFKHAYLRHPLHDAVNAETRQLLNIGPLPRGGNGYTVNNTGRPDRQPTGATFRVVVDTADWDSALATNSPGQAGDPAAPHYRDLFAPWATGQHFPLYFSPEKIAEVTTRQFQLQPAP